MFALRRSGIVVQQNVSLKRAGLKCLYPSRQYSSLIDNAFGWFKDSKNSKNKSNQSATTETAAAAAASKVNTTTTTDLMKNIENGESLDSSIDSNNASANTNNAGKETEETVKLNLNEIEVIGKAGTKLFKEQQRKRELLSTVGFNQWWSTEKVATSEKFNEILQKINNDLKLSCDQPFTDLQTKFEFSKKLQQMTGYMLSDYDITRFSTPSKFQNFFEKKIFSGEMATYNEHLPNAIYLDVTSKGGKINDTYNNVYISPNVPEHEQKKTFNKINNEATYLKKQSA